MVDKREIFSPIIIISPKPLCTSASLHCLVGRLISFWPNVVAFSSCICTILIINWSFLLKITDVDYTAFFTKNYRYEYLAWQTQLDLLDRLCCRKKTLFPLQLGLLCAVLNLCFVHNYEWSEISRIFFFIFVFRVFLEHYFCERSSTYSFNFSWHKTGIK